MTNVVFNAQTVVKSTIDSNRRANNIFVQQLLTAVAYFGHRPLCVTDICYKVINKVL